MEEEGVEVEALPCASSDLGRGGEMRRVGC